jgi:hypothetical protein
MNVKTLTALVALAGATVGVTACTPAVTACTVRHHYAIVVLENGGSTVGKTLVKQFRLNVRYSPYFVQHRMIYDRITLRPVRGPQLPVAIKTYWVGHARSCGVDRVRTYHSSHRITGNHR